MHLLGLGVDDRTVRLALDDIFFDHLFVFNFIDFNLAWLWDELRVVGRTRGIPSDVVVLIEAISSIVVDVWLMLFVLEPFDTRRHNIVWSSLKIIRSAEFVQIRAYIFVPNVLVWIHCGQ